MDRKWKKSDIHTVIDHSIVKATATDKDVRIACAEAKKYGFASVCVNPGNVSLCVRELGVSGIPVCSVVGFPLGASSSDIKAQEARLAVAEGASEIDMVMNIGKAKSGDWKAVEEDIAAVVRAAAPATVKVILETCYLTTGEKVRACAAAANAGATFVQTSTGFGTGGATLEDIALLRSSSPASLKVKAAGGIRTARDALAMLEAGAERIGASSGVAIIADAED